MRKQVSPPVIAFLLVCAVALIGMVGYYVFLRDRKPADMEQVGRSIDRAREKWMQDHPELMQGVTPQQYREAAAGNTSQPGQGMAQGNAVERLRGQQQGQTRP